MDPTNRATSIPDRPLLPPSVAGLGGLAVLVVAVIALALVRGPYGPSGAAISVEETAKPTTRAVGSEPKASASARASAGRPGDGDAVEQGATGTPAPLPPDAEAALAQFKGRWKVRDAKGALAAAEQLAQLDKEAFKDSDLQSDIVSMTQLLSQMPGDVGDRVFKLLTENTGPYGLDVLLYLVTSKGGSHAANLAAKLLAKPEVLERGSKAMRVAYELRSAPCDKKKALFKRAGEDGDRRALAQLQIISKTSCSGRRRGGCCYEKDAELEAAEKAIEARVVR